VRVVAELGKHPGGEDGSQTWLGAVDFDVRVPVKMGSQLTFDGVDLAGQFGQDPHQGGHGVPEGGLDGRQRRQLVRAQRGLDLRGAGLEIAMPTGPTQHRSDL
jgi:hypothetical protein